MANEKKISVVVLADCHKDDVICVFTKPSRALQWARQQVERYQRRFKKPLDLDPELTQSMEQCGWTYYKRLPAEIGSVRIEAIELNKERG